MTSPPPLPTGRQANPLGDCVVMAGGDSEPASETLELRSFEGDG